MIKRIILGKGHPWFPDEHNVHLTKGKVGSGKWTLMPLKIQNLSNDDEITLVAEIKVKPMRCRICRRTRSFVGNEPCYGRSDTKGAMRHKWVK